MIKGKRGTRIHKDTGIQENENTQARLATSLHSAAANIATFTRKCTSGHKRVNPAARRRRCPKYLAPVGGMLHSNIYIFVYLYIYLHSLLVETGFGWWLLLLFVPERAFGPVWFIRAQ